ncbi:MAG TPA: DUF3488 and transglutaminase-like domain-containing protein [Jatrophihabitans sp.]|nr:DUF3488 and transglutaminase-like domain-containing protein [Jatrophihabitans sp.]
MTATTKQAQRPAGTAPADPTRSGTRRTLLALLASALGVVPLMSLFLDAGWLVDVWLAMLVVIGPAALLRLRRPPGALDVWPGVVLLIPWLTLRFVPVHAWGGLLPTRATAHDVSLLMDSLHHTTHDEAAPVHTTVAIRLVLCALLALLAALVDLVAVVARRGALAGVPLLVVYTVAGAVPRSPVSWVWFAVAAVGFLILLGLDAEDELHRWGRRIPRRGGSRAGLAAPFSAQRIGVIAVAVAVIAPLLFPAQSRNLITDLFHNGHGAGGGSGTAGISPFATLKGQLTRDKPIDLFTVHIENWRDGSAMPFYLRTNVLDQFTGGGWVVGGSDDLGSINSSFDYRLPPGQTRTIDYSVRIKISGLTGTAPLFARSTTFTGLAGVSFKDEFQVLTGSHVFRGQTYHQTFAQPDPTSAQLAQAGTDAGVDASPWLRLPTLPRLVDNLVAKITKGKASAYQKARAISDYFANPANNFQYSLKTKGGDSGSDLVDFLQNRVGYCQQYAAAMAVMLRQAGVPARVVLGYMHPVPDTNGNFTVSTVDAHAWVEAYFKGVGWTPFDPTPIEGLDGGNQSDLGYAPHDYSVTGSAASSSGRGRQAPTGPEATVPTSTSAAPAATGQGRGVGPSAWVGLGVLVAVLLGLVPAMLRVLRRRRRVLAARNGDPDPLWAELSDTAVDLGYVWSPARSPRQVADWLARDTREPDALRSLAVAVEHRRYSRDAEPQNPTELHRNFKKTVGHLRAGRRLGVRLRAWLWPASLRIGRRGRGTRASNGNRAH